MNGFHGKAYRYKDKVIGVCNTLRDGIYMIGHKTTGGHKRVKVFPLFESIDKAQAKLDDYARGKGLPEVQG